MAAAKIRSEVGVGNNWREFAAGTVNLLSAGPPETLGYCARRLVPKAAGSFTACVDSAGNDEQINNFAAGFVHEAHTQSVVSDVAFVAYW